MNRFLLFLFFSVSVFADNKPHISSFSPQGAVKNVTQVKVHFSHPMTAFGNPRTKTDQFRVSCTAKGKARWLDDRNYVYEFEKPLEAGVECEFKLKDEVKTLSGAEITGRKIFSFNTGGPAVLDVRPYSGSIVDENQIFILRTDSDVDSATLSGNVYFMAEGNPDKIGAVFLKKEEAKEIIDSLFKGKTDRKTFFIKSRLRFPHGKQIKLVWGKSVKTKSGFANAQDQVQDFTVRENFKISFSCERENKNSACLPMLPMRLSFSSSVARELAEKVELKGSSGEVYPIEFDRYENGNLVNSVKFKPPFPEKSKFTIHLPENFQDDSGRKPESGIFPMKTSTSDFPPLAKFPGRFGILELEADTSLPVTVRNLEPGVKSKITGMGNGASGSYFGKLTGSQAKISPESVLHWIKKVEKANREVSVFSDEKNNVQSFALPKTEGDKAFEVLGIPLKSPGFYVVEIESTALAQSLLEKKKVMYVPTSVLVTGMAVHFKTGRENSLVWVTSLKTGEPVNDAKITVYDCKGKNLFSGETDEKGLVFIKNRLNDPKCSYETDYSYGFLVTAEKEKDFSFTHTSWEKGIENWRYKLSFNSDGNDVHAAHTVMDRTLFRAGETLHMKHIFRRESMNGLEFPREKDLPESAEITHEGSGQKYTFKLKWNERGYSETVWKLPEEVKLGAYSVALKSGKDRFISTASFQVEEFRVPLMKGEILLPSENLVRPSSLDVGLSASYFSGGTAGGLPVKFKYYFEDVSSFSVPEYEDFIFSNGSVQEGRRDAHSYTDFEEYSGEEESEHAAVPKKKNTIIKKELKLDRTGSAKFSIPEIPAKTSIQTLVTEMEYKDPNGEIQTIMKGSSIYPSDILVGIRDEGWSSSEKVKAEAAVLNLKRQPMSNVDVEILIYKKENYSYRRRLVGGFYAYDNFSEVKPAGVFCSGKTNANGIFSCEKSIPVKGTVYLAAKAKGKQGTEVYANKEIWIAGDDEYWFDAHNSDRMDIIPDRKEYKPGDTAKIQVKAPFQKFKALVTTEREGIMDAFIVDLTGKNPVAEVPVKGNHAPNVFVSVFAVRGRTADPKPTALVDLGKPSYKLGITQLNVDRQKHELTVKVSSDRENYKARETVRAKVKVSPKSGSGRIEKGEIAVAVVDEGLLDLKPNETWKVLENMLKTRSLTVQTSTAQMQVIGRRHFGRKAIAPGGGGGKDSTRELFDTLVYWKSVISLNSEGEAEFSFPLNDSMTSFRIVALAGADSDRFGTGYTSIKSSKDLMLISGLPTLMREGDTFYPEVTVRNTTGSEKEVTVSGKLVKPEISLEEKKFRLGAGESREVFWKLETPVSVDKLTYEISAVSGNEQDKIRITQKVGASVPVSVIQGTLRQVDREMEMPVEFPKDAVPGRGGIQVNLSPSLLDSVSGVKDYMRHYSYTCMEQEISKSISLEDRERWNRVIQKMPAYLDRDGLLKYFPNMEDGSVILTSYALSISNEAGLEIPEFSREKMTAALEGFVNGTLARKSYLSAADLTLQKLGAIEALSRYGKAVPAMLEPLHFQVQLLPTSSVLDYFNVLNRLEVSDRAAKIKSAEQVLLARMNMQGSTMKFTSEANDSLWWLMVSPDVNAVRLILSMTGAGKWKDNMGRIMRGVLSRQKKGSWDITTANAWGVLAVKKFASEYEKETVSGKTSVSLFDSTTSADWKEKPKGSVINVGWKEKPDTMKISHTGSGKPWAVIYSRAAVPLKESVSNGYTVKKTMIPLEVKNPGKWTRGDIYRVQLKVKADSDMTWVVISDPIPAGASILTGGLRKTSAVEGEKTDYNVYPAYEERSYEAYRIYYEYIPEGEFTVEYTVRLNQEGKFTVPQTRIEAMYSPDMNGETPNGQMDVSRE